MTATGPVPVWVPLHHRDAIEVQAARAVRLAAEVIVRVRCGGQLHTVRLHTVRLQAGRLRLDGHPPAGRQAITRTQPAGGNAGGTMVGVPRCLAVLDAWRAAPRPGRGYWVRSARKPDR